ncbi:glycosyltransferase family 2 protein [Limnoglobus roseus]|uniref:GT2 family glycosyltransferase n=1 Tax=Limnoglobus roseus TaxID=2598579 RepID=A0A5C1A9X3_9BACT|nr:glycosyltransferase family 2 protein [Limnoglobus roseus]QEL13924.1 GT2 family glycosyltransferase [Limnoglobus roseus]
MIALLVALIFLVPATAACLYYVGFALLGQRRSLAPSDRPNRRIAVLIPAHDEELSLGLSLESILKADYPAELRTVVVVADNCTDGTTRLAQQFGVTALERTDAVQRGKGYALALGLESILAERPDAVLILDADCQIEPETFRVLDAHLEGGAEAVQCAVLTRNADDASTSFVGAMGNVFDNLLSAGKDRVGRPVPLRGSGMCFRRDVLERFPWQDFGLTEDAEYSDRLAAGGVRVRFEGRPLVRSETPTRQGDLYQQRRRWRAALFGGPGFVLRCVESKPLVLAQLLATGLLVGVAANFTLAAWYGVLVLLTGGVYLYAAAQVGLTWRRIGYLLSAPWIVARLVGVTLGGFVPREMVWQRTRRAAEVET